MVLVFFAKNSVIPLNLFFKKVFLAIGPLISLLLILFWINFIAILKQEEMYSFDLGVILSNALVCLKSTFIKFIFFKLFFFLIRSSSLIRFKLIFSPKTFACFKINCSDAIKIIGDLIFFFITLKKI